MRTSRLINQSQKTTHPFFLKIRWYAHYNAKHQLVGDDQPHLRPKHRDKFVFPNIHICFHSNKTMGAANHIVKAGIYLPTIILNIFITIQERSGVKQGMKVGSPTLGNNGIEYEFARRD